MLCTIPDEKAALRTAVRTTLAGLSDTERRESDRLLMARFLRLPQVQRADTLLLFYGVGTEANTVPILSALLDRGKTVALPRCLPNRGMEARVYTDPGDLVRGTLGIPEPSKDCARVERDRIDLILVPALCYDRAGYRLGQGGGYYDRYLKQFSGVTVGLCRGLVLWDALPCEDHDLPATLVLTEGEIFPKNSTGAEPVKVPPPCLEDTVK